jgi:inorganic triphosphatase YgiF
MGLEVEARFRAEDPAALDRLGAMLRLGDSTLGSPRAIDELDRYLDTDDGRFAAARWAFRLRTREGRTFISLKGPRALGDGPIHRRQELEGPASERLDAAEWPPSEALALVLEIGGGRRLVERFRLHQLRTERDVEDGHGRRLGTLTLDRVRIEEGGRDLGELHVVELELLAGAGGEDEARLAALAEALGRVSGLVPEPRTKRERAMERMAAT